MLSILAIELGQLHVLENIAHLNRDVVAFDPLSNQRAIQQTTQKVRGLLLTEPSEINFVVWHI